MSGGGAAIIGVKEEKARIGNLEITKETAFVATDEGFVAVERHRVEQIRQRPALRQPPQRQRPSGREYPWYGSLGKGCGMVILLLLFYLVVGDIFLPLVIIGALIYCLRRLFCSSSDDTR